MLLESCAQVFASLPRVVGASHACSLCTQVWLPLLPRIGAPGFELVFAEGWSLR
jgi:hypothetical protein